MLPALSAICANGCSRRARSPIPSMKLAMSVAILTNTGAARVSANRVRPGATLSMGALI